MPHPDTIRRGDLKYNDHRYVFKAGDTINGNISISGDVIINGGMEFNGDVTATCDFSSVNAIINDCYASYLSAVDIAANSIVANDATISAISAQGLTVVNNVNIDGGVDIAKALDVHSYVNMDNGYIVNLRYIKFYSSSDYVIRFENDNDTGIYYNTAKHRLEWRYNGSSKHTMELATDVASFCNIIADGSFKTENGDVTVAYGHYIGCNYNEHLIKLSSKVLVSGELELDDILDANNNVDIAGTLDVHNNTTIYGSLDIVSDVIRLRASKTPASAGAAGNAGDICWDSDYIYICTSTNTWKRVQIATWT